MTTLVAAIAADLISDTVAAAAAGPMAAFAPLVGSWDLCYVHHRGSGERIDGTGYVRFGWGLQGLAIVDIWAFDGAAVVGTTIRFYDPKIDGFRSTWICPARNVLLPFVGRVIDERIVLDATLADPPGRRVRWAFVSIEAERFSWTGEISDDGGTTWLRTQEIEGTRRPAG
ncbi:MAG TPA: hypothetical protein VMD91_11090 [Candidatus Sulfotelmatobacter sp.]|nr:hypothetical protein [Candidatus Sulfotelmatobacter sp.]